MHREYTSLRRLVLAFALLLAVSSLAALIGCGGGSSSSTTPPSTGFTQTPFIISIEIQPAAPSLSAGGTQNFTATAIYSNGTTQDVTSSATWASNATSIVSMNGATATGATPGSTYITATSGKVVGHTIVSVGPPPSGGAATYYVSPSGSDSNNGMTVLNAFLTLDHARQVVAGRAGTVVELESGSYYLPATVNFTSSDSGTASSPIVYRAAPGATVIISGGTRITGWTNTSGNVWTVSLPAGNCGTQATSICNFEGLYYQPSGSSDMQRRARPRTTSNTPCPSSATGGTCPSYLYNSASNPIYSSSSTTYCTLSTDSGYECLNEFIFNGTDVAASYHDMALGDVEILDFEKWTMSRLRLLSVSGNTATLTSPAFDGNQYGFFPQHRFLVENCDPGLDGTAIDPGCLVEPGQWYLDRCPNANLSCPVPNGQSTWTLAYNAESGAENPNTDTVIVPQQLQLIVANGASNIVFQGLTFSNDNWLPGNPPVSGVTCASPVPCGLGDTSGSPGVSAEVSFTNAQNVVFNQCTFSHAQGWGVEFEGASSGNQVVNSTFYDIGTGAVRIGQYPAANDSNSTVPQYNLVENNILDALGRVQPSGIGSGVWVGNAHHNVVAHNDIHDLYNGAIELGLGFTNAAGPILGSNNIAAFNHLYDLGQGVTSDMAGVHVGAVGTTGNMILNNLIHDVNHNYLDPDSYGGNGLYFDNSTTQALAHNNLAFRLTGFGVFNNLAGGNNAVTTQDNVVLNNIIALPQKAVIQRGGDLPYSLAFVQNIVYYDYNGPVMGGHWNCPDNSCTNQFLFNNNDYWNTSGTAPQFITTTSGGSGSPMNLAAWQALGEDTNSIFQNPQFVDAGNTAPDSGTPPTDGFTLQGSSPAFSAPVNFQSFNPALAGLSNQSPSFVAPPTPPTLSCTQGTYEGACPAFPLEIYSNY